MVTCWSCGEHSGESQNVCGTCGALLTLSPLFRLCTKCGELLPVVLERCSFCGEVIVDRAGMPETASMMPSEFPSKE